MSIFRKHQVVLYKDSESMANQIAELKELEKQAKGELKKEISTQIRLLERGNYGEDEILFNLNYCDLDMFVLRDVNIVIDGLSAQIDYYVITPKLHFIIECKNLYGNITINNKGDFIRSYDYHGKNIKEGIESPITQNERHMLVLKNCRINNAGAIKTAIITHNFWNFTKPLVVLANEKTILNDRYAPKGIKNQVIRADALAKTIKKMEAESNEAKCNLKSMEQQAERVMSWHTENRTDYVAKYREAVERQIAAKTKATPAIEVQKEANSEQSERACPRCKEGKLVERNGKRGRFIGCSRYPKCRYTEDIIEGE